MQFNWNKDPVNIGQEKDTEQEETHDTLIDDMNNNSDWTLSDFDGNVSASISKKDYLAFTEELAFDQLCDSLGKLFIEFMDY